MTIKFNNIDDIEAFLDITQSLRGDVIVGEGNVQIDGKSPMGMMGLDLNKEYPIFLFEKDNAKEIGNFIKNVTKLGIVI